jgi:hypothetical protein
MGKVGGGPAVLWLDRGMKEGEAASDLLKPCDARLMRGYPISTHINVANDDEECSRPVEVARFRIASLPKQGDFYS